jgi:hypothetical protein
VKGNRRPYDGYKLHRTASDHNGPVGCGPVQSHSNRPPPFRGGGSVTRAMLPSDECDNENDRGLVRSDAICTSDGDDRSEDVSWEL